jgi:ABC-2 type transport system ATP-binding protein
MNPVISIQNVTKTFPTGIFSTKTAVDNLTLEIPKGQVIGLLGANGSGKSTTLKMLLGFLRPTSGSIRVCDVRAGTRESRQLIGYLPENPRFQRFLTGRDILHYFGKLYGMSGKALAMRTEELLQMVGLGRVGDERVQGYSKGMTQRLAIAQAILNRPAILIFDEPMSGLDPLGRIEIRDLIRKLHSELSETTIFFTTHILNDVESLCNWVALLKKGKLEVYCPIASLLDQDCELFQITTTPLPENIRKEHFRNAAVTETPLGPSFSIEGSAALASALSIVRGCGGRIVSLNSKRKGLEEALFSDKVGIQSLVRTEATL